MLPTGRGGIVDTISRGVPLWPALAAAGICLGVAGCRTLPGDLAVQRASKEFVCPTEKIGVIQRSDISDHVYDLEACGQRVRYSCRSLPDDNLLLTENDPNQCVREKDPPKWDPDPAAIATLPRPSSPVRLVRSSAGEARKICGACDARTGVDCPGNGCIFRDNGSWRGRDME
jgi:hypothetical protein